VNWRIGWLLAAILEARIVTPGRPTAKHPLLHRFEPQLPAGGADTASQTYQPRGNFMHDSRSLALALLSRRARLLLVSVVFAVLPAKAAVIQGFQDSLITSIGSPTALAFTPDGRILVTTKGGSLYVVRNGQLLPGPALGIPPSQICTESERGLLGVAVDPGYATNHFIYVFYTFRRPDAVCVNRVSRFELPNDVASPASQVVLVDNMPSPAGNHNGGDLQIGKDGLLYVTIGDGGCDYAGNSGCGGANDAARDQHVLTGKVLRVTTAGGIPASNPFQGAGTAACAVTGATTAGNRCRETFAWGFRNPFRLAMDPNAAGTRFFVNDVGQGLWEEVDEGQSGADYGWNLCEGAHANNSTGPCSAAPAGMVPPVYEYRHGVTIPGTTSPTNCNSITGGAFVPNGLWSGFDGVYLFADFVCGEIFRLTTVGGYAASDFASALGGVVHLAFGPHGERQALYYTTFAGGGQVRRITGDLSFHTLAPCRLVDTRRAPGPTGGPALQPNATRSFPAVGSCGVPPSAVAIAVNLTVAAPTAPGSITAYATGSTPPGTSNLNFTAGQTRANNAVVMLGANTHFSVLSGFASGSAHLAVDVVGYFE
jgi:glucose/arabinose dehydrogenase